MTKDIFISYAHEDENAAKAIVRFLNDAGYTTWFDKDDLLGGQEWEQIIPKAIKSSHIVLLLLSKSSVEKRGFVQKELRMALEEASKIPPNEIYIMPARLNDCIRPDPVSRYHIIDLFDENGFDKLLESIKGGLGKPYKEPQTKIREAVKTALKKIDEQTPLNFTKERSLSHTAQKLLNEICQDTHSEEKGMMIGMMTPVQGFYVPYLWDNHIHGAMSVETSSMAGIKRAIEELETAGLLTLLDKRGNSQWYSLVDK